MFSACFRAFSSVFQVSVVRSTTSKPTRTTFDMAAMRARKLADGSVSYTAQIRIKRDGVQVYQESQTFARKQAAQAWARESELDEPGAIERASRKGATAKEMIDQYLRKVESAWPHSIEMLCPANAPPAAPPPRIVPWRPASLGLFSAL